MINLYFNKPNDAIIKVDNTTILDYHSPVKIYNPLLLEYLSFSQNYDSFCTKIDIKKQIYGQNTEIIQFNEDNYLINCLPNIKTNSYFLMDYKNIEDYSFYLVGSGKFQLIITQNSNIIKVLNLPKNLLNPTLFLYNKFVVISGNIDTKKYLLIMDKSFKIRLNISADKIISSPEKIKIINNYHDTLQRTRYSVYKFNEDISLENTYFEYKKSDSNNLPLLFIEAYIAEDFTKIKEYLSFDVNYNILHEYLQNITLVKCPFEKEGLYFTNSYGNFKVARTIECKISNNKIDTFDLI